MCVISSGHGQSSMEATDMNIHKRSPGERRRHERRSGADTRSETEREAVGDRRSPSDRRSGSDRRLDAATTVVAKEKLTRS
jgi:hypothetical protein